MDEIRIPDITPDFSSIEFTPEPSPAVDVSQALIDQLEDIKAVVGDVSSTVLNRFAAYYNNHYTGSLNPPAYVIWRSTQYDYHMAVFPEGQYSNGTVTGSFDLISYYSNSYYDTLPTVNVQTVQNRNLDIPAPASSGSGYVYSSLPGYLPASSVDQSSNLSIVISISMLIILLVSVAYVWIGRIFHGKK